MPGTRSERQTAAEPLKTHGLMCPSFWGREIRVLRQGTSWNANRASGGVLSLRLRVGSKTAAWLGQCTSTVCPAACRRRAACDAVDQQHRRIADVGCDSDLVGMGGQGAASNGAEAGHQQPAARQQKRPAGVVGTFLCRPVARSAPHAGVRLPQPPRMALWQPAWTACQLVSTERLRVTGGDGPGAAPGGGRTQRGGGGRRAAAARAVGRRSNSPGGGAASQPVIWFRDMHPPRQQRHPAPHA